MTIFDLLFLALFLAALAALILAAVYALRGRTGQAFGVLRRLTACTVVYLGMVYVITALSKPVVLKIGDPQCNDDWCIAVEGVLRTPKAALVAYDVKLRIFSRARRVAMRENGATDVYLVDSDWKRYQPIPDGTEIPLNTLLQPGQSVTTGRTFELPPDAHDIGLLVQRSGLPVCLIIGECGAFHRGPMIRID